MDSLCGLLLVRLDLKLGKYPVVKSTYSGISLVSWLEWKGKTVKDIYMRQHMWGQGQVRSDWRTGQRSHNWNAATADKQQRYRQRHTHTHIDRVLCVGGSRASARRLWRSAGPVFTPECLCEELRHVDIEPYAWCCLRFVTWTFLFTATWRRALASLEDGWKSKNVSSAKGTGFIFFFSTPAPKTILHQKWFSLYKALHISGEMCPF